MYATSTQKKEQATLLIDRKFPFIFSTLIFVFTLLPSFTNLCFSQWFNWLDATSTRLVVSSVANSDPEEKDMWTEDFNNDGKQDLIVVRNSSIQLVLLAMYS